MVILGKDGKQYNTVKECLAADKLFDEQEAAKAAEKEKSINAISAKKKDLANAIEKAEEARKLAVQNYRMVDKKASEHIAKAQKEAQAMLDEARKQLKDAVTTKSEAVMNFNKEFGAYKVTLTGNDALNELNQLVQDLNKNIFTFWF